MQRLKLTLTVNLYVLSEEINDEKTATQLLRKGFLDADEANLLEEEGRHPLSISSMIKCYSWSLLLIMYFRWHLHCRYACVWV